MVRYWEHIKDAFITPSFAFFMLRKKVSVLRQTTLFVIVIAALGLSFFRWHFFLLSLPLYSWIFFLSTGEGLSFVLCRLLA